MQKQYCIDIQQLCDIKGQLHASLLDTNNVFIACNPLKLSFCHDLYGVDNIIGKKPCDFSLPEEKESIEALYLINKIIIEQRVSKQLYHTWVIQNRYRLDLLTFKMPIFDLDNEAIGVLSVSHFINKFSVDKAFQLGLTKRESECLFYLFEGNTAKEIAAILNLSYRTVEGYIENMKNKFDCATTTELQLIALQNEINENIYASLTFNHSNKISPLSDKITGANHFYIKETEIT